MGRCRCWFFFEARSERRIGGDGSQGDFAADEFEIDVAQKGAGKQASLDENLKTVADSEDRTAGGGEFTDGSHDGREAGDGTAAQVIAVGETAGQNDGIEAAEICGIVPDKAGLMGQIAL